ncbi:flagellar filament capping protein FliD [Rheinheimera marina]|uniref:Flagellar hook-associated protein 2 n=1 Tax=Rheinheimera marina TaxID=1774958 RepID=A0ABV9JJI4_9GAMM
MAFSSIDPATLASQYTQIERAGKDEVLKAQQTRFTNLLSSYTKLQTSLTSLNDLFTSFVKDKELLSNSGTVSDETALTLSVDGTAASGNYEIFVEKLAQQHQLSLAFGSTETLPTDGQFELTVAGESFAVDLSTLPAGAKLSDLATAINKAADNSGVLATVMRSNGQAYLVLTSEESGAANTISMNFVPGADSSGADIAGAVAGATTLKSAQDAVFRIGSDNAISLTSTTNTLEYVISGVTIELKKAQQAGDTPLQISISQDSTAVQEKLQKFVDSYNSMMKQISSDSSLKSDSMARSISNQMRGSFQQMFQGRSLTSIGLEFDRNGVLTLDSEKFSEALEQDPLQIEQMLVAEDGLFGQMQSRLEPYTKRSGLLSSKQQSIQSSIDLVATRQKRHDYSMEQVYQRYVAQFTQMQVTIAQLESSMSQFG